MRTAAAVLWLVVAARSSAVLAQGLQGAEETAIAADVDTAAAPLAEDAAVCECTDSATWTSPANGGSCRTYKIGGVNEGYCAADDAWAVCPSACDSCPECERGGVSEDVTAMLWLGVPCMVVALCGPFLKTVYFHLKEDRKTIVQSEAEAKQKAKVAEIAAAKQKEMAAKLNEGAAHPAGEHPPLAPIASQRVFLALLPPTTTAPSACSVRTHRQLVAQDIARPRRLQHQLQAVPTRLRCHHCWVQAAHPPQEMPSHRLVSSTTAREPSWS
jgi:hypothetical protein